MRRLGIGILAATTASIPPAAAEPRAGSVPSHRGGAGRTRAVTRWEVITIGNLSRNRYWGESDARPVRSAICTSTVIQGDGFRLLVDPSLADAEQMAAELDRRTGLKPRDITAIFITHEHADHWYGLAHFPAAKWLAAADVAAGLNKTGKLAKAVEPAADTLYDAVEVLPTPGHTLNHHSLRFDCEGLCIVVAGDAVATRDFWRERRGYFNCADFELSAESMGKIAALADIVVPGHDNFFLTATPLPGRRDPHPDLPTPASPKPL